MGLTVYGGGGKPEEEKTVTAGTSAIVVNPSSGKVMKKVTVNPTPTEEKTITAGTSATTVTPTSGKYIKKVTVNPTPSQSKTVTPSTSQQTVSPDSGKLLSKVIVKAMEDVTPEVTAQTPVITQIAENLGVTITTPSGTNKQILQGNNANLLNIKNNAKKEGAYVWKKSRYIDNKDIIINVLTTSAPSTMKAVSSDYDLSQVDESFFVGYVGILNDNGTNTRLTFKDGGVLLIEWGTNFSSSSNNTYSYNPSTQVITISSAWFTTPSGTFSKDDETEFIEFVVSDSETAYPDGGLQGGYWYERVGEVTPEMFGCTKMAVDKFTFSSRSNLNNALSHSLGEIPQIAIVMCDNTPIVNYDIDFAITLQCTQNPYYTAIRYLASQKTAMNAYSVSPDHRTDATIQILSGSYGGTTYFTAGVEYTLITMA